MTRWIFVVVASILAASCNTPGETTDVRNVRWGMSQQEVMEAEVLPLSEDSDVEYGVLVYFDYINGETVRVSYGITDDKLHRVVMQFKNDDDLRGAVETLLTDKYGEGTVTEGVESISSGFYVRKWITSRTEITLHAWPSDPKEPGFYVEYRPASKNLDDMKDLF